jgi:hypothetical protein
LEYQLSAERTVRAKQIKRERCIGLKNVERAEKVEIKDK